MRGGVLTIAPIVDIFLRRRVRWFSWAALLFTSLAAVGVATLPHERSQLTAIARCLNLGGVSDRLHAASAVMTHVAKVDDPAVTRRYFVREMLVAWRCCSSCRRCFALGGVRRAARRLLRSLSGERADRLPLRLPLHLFGTLIYLDRRENTFCIPLNRGSSLLAGITATFILLHRLGGFPGVLAAISPALRSW